MRLDSLYYAMSLAEGRTEDPKSPIIDYLRQIAKNHHIAITVIGGMALPAHNYARWTSDIDFLVTQSGAYKVANALLNTGEFEDIGGNKLKHKSDVIVNICPEGVKAGKIKFPAPNTKKGELDIVNLSLLLALKISASRYKDRADAVELIKRNKVSKEQLIADIIPLIKMLNPVAERMAIALHNKAIKELEE